MINIYRDGQENIIDRVKKYKPSLECTIEVLKVEIWIVHNWQIFDSDLILLPLDCNQSLNSFFLCKTKNIPTSEHYRRTARLPLTILNWLCLLLDVYFELWWKATSKTCSRKTGSQFSGKYLMTDQSSKIFYVQGRSHEQTQPPQINVAGLE